MSAVVALYTFIFVLLVLLVVFRYLWSRQAIRERIEQVDLNVADAPQFASLRGMISKLSVYFESSSWAMKKEEMLMQSGVLLRGSEFMVVSIGSAVFTTVLLLLILGKSHFLIALAAGVGGFNIPLLIVKLKINKKRALLNEQLPAALTLIANSLRSGYSYMQAIDLASKEMLYPIGDEFAIVVKEINLGISTEEAFTNMVKRVNCDDLDLMVTAFLIQRQVGGNLAELLDGIAETIRDRMNMKNKIKSLTAQGQLSALIMCLLPLFIAGVIFFINGPYMMSFVGHKAGQIAIVAAIILQVVGVIWMKKIVNIDV
ncbi:MAG: type secretion system protein [Firmicutes bacterium]|nr:type secretion system protein [Bacillota bacterium]